MDQKNTNLDVTVPEQSNLVHLPDNGTPMDVVISRHIQNMMATFGPEKVRASLQELFGIQTDKIEEKAVGYGVEKY